MDGKSIFCYLKRGSNVRPYLRGSAELFEVLLQLQDNAKYKQDLKMQLRLPIQFYFTSGLESIEADLQEKIYVTLLKLLSSVLCISNKENRIHVISI
jgi:hypothetical protein